MKMLLSALLLTGLNLCGEGFLSNGDFEEEFKGWDVWHKGMKDLYVKIDYDAKSGNKSLCFIGDRKYELNDSLNCSQPYIQLKPETAYILSGRMLCRNPGQDPLKRIQASIIERDAGNKVIETKTMHLSWGNAKGAWYNFKEPFATGKNSGGHYQLVLYAKNLGTDEKIFIDDLKISVDESQKEPTDVKSYLKMLSEKAKDRKRKTERTFVFCRVSSLTNKGGDEVLSVSASGGGEQAVKLNGYNPISEIGLFKAYGLDGAAFFCHTPDVTREFVATCGQLNTGNSKIMAMPGFYGRDEMPVYAPIFEKSILSDSVFRYKGKVVTIAFGADYLTPAQWTGIITKLRKKYSDNFLFIADIRHLMTPRQLNSGAASVDMIKSDLKRLRDYLNVFDGVIYSGTGSLVAYDSSVVYGASLDMAYIDSYLVPLLKTVLAEPEYKNKLLGLGVTGGSFDPVSGFFLRPEGTSTLINSFKSAVDAEPDFILGPDWVDSALNSSFGPTVSKSLAQQRIVRYFCRQLKNLPPLPEPGDDIELPDLIYSCRRTAAIGEKLELELLNIPASKSTQEYTVELAILNGAGDTVKRFAPVKMKICDLAVKKIELDTAAFAGDQVLYPVLKISGYENRMINITQGLPYLRLVPSGNADYVTRSQSLRDLCRPQYSLQWRTMNGKITFTGDVSAKEKIVSLQILEDDRPVWSYKPNPKSMEHIKASFECSFKMQSAFPVYSMRIITASGSIFRSPPQLPERYSRQKQVTVKVFSDIRNKSIKIKLPEKAVVDLKYDLSVKHGKTVVSAGKPEWDGVLHGDPKREKIKNEWALEFDGRNDYITFPRETLSVRGFTVIFDVKPANGSNMVLLRTFYRRTSFFSLIIYRGKLFGAYLGKAGTVYFDTDAAVPMDKWSRIGVKFEPGKMVFNVNGKVKAYDLPSRPEYYGPLCFGGPVTPGPGVPARTGYFKGILKNLNIKH